MTAIRHYHAPDGTFRKVLPHDRARREVAGWKAVSRLLPVPRLWGARDTGEGCEVIYADVFATGQSRRLLADSINAADREPSLTVTVRTLVDTICDSVLAATDATGTVSTLGECVPDLHLAPGSSPAGAWTAGTPTRRTRPGSSTASNSTSMTWPAGP